jgi:hypothetical protein
VRAPGAILLPAADELFSISNPRCFGPHGDSARLESRPGEHEETPQLVLIHLADGFDDVGVKGHMGKWVL